MTPALRKVRAHAKNVAVHERNRCLCTYKSFESFDFGIVDPHHHLMTVDESSIGAVEQDAAVADHSTRVVRSSLLLLLLLHRSCCWWWWWGGGGGGVLDIVLCNVILDIILHSLFSDVVLVAGIDRHFHVVYQSLHYLWLEATVVHPVSQQRSHLWPKRRKLEVIVKLQLPWIYSPSHEHIGMSWSVAGNKGSEEPGSIKIFILLLMMTKKKRSSSSRSLLLCSAWIWFFFLSLDCCSIIVIGSIQELLDLIFLSRSHPIDVRILQTWFIEVIGIFKSFLFLWIVVIPARLPLLRRRRRRRRRHLLSPIPQQKTIEGEETSVGAIDECSSRGDESCSENSEDHWAAAEHEEQKQAVQHSVISAARICDGHCYQLLLLLLLLLSLGRCCWALWHGCHKTKIWNSFWRDGFKLAKQGYPWSSENVLWFLPFITMSLWFAAWLAVKTHQYSNKTGILSGDGFKLTKQELWSTENVLWFLSTHKYLCVHTGILWKWFQAHKTRSMENRKMFLWFLSTHNVSVLCSVPGCQNTQQMYSTGILRRWCQAWKTRDMEDWLSVFVLLGASGNVKTELLQQQRFCFCCCNCLAVWQNVSVCTTRRIAATSSQNQPVSTRRIL